MQKLAFYRDTIQLVNKSRNTFINNKLNLKRC